MIGLFGELDDVGAFLDGVADGLFEIDVLVRLQRGHRHRVVQVLGRSDEDDVDVRVGEQLAIIDVGLRAWSFLRSGRCPCPCQVALVGIADGDDVDQILAGRYICFMTCLPRLPVAIQPTRRRLFWPRTGRHARRGNHGRSGGFL